MTYTVLDKRPFPGQRADGSLGTVYEIIFTSPPDVARDSITVDKLDPQEVDRLIKAKIEEHKAIANLGG